MGPVSGSVPIRLRAPCAIHSVTMESSAKQCSIGTCAISQEDQRWIFPDSDSSGRDELMELRGRLVSVDSVSGVSAYKSTLGQARILLEKWEISSSFLSDEMENRVQASSKAALSPLGGGTISPPPTLSLVIRWREGRGCGAASPFCRHDPSSHCNSMYK